MNRDTGIAAHFRNNIYINKTTDSLESNLVEIYSGE